MPFTLKKKKGTQTDLELVYNKQGRGLVLPNKWEWEEIKHLSF